MLKLDKRKSNRFFLKEKKKRRSKWLIIISHWAEEISRVLETGCKPREGILPRFFTSEQVLRVVKEILERRPNKDIEADILVVILEKLEKDFSPEVAKVLYSEFSEIISKAFQN